MNKNIFLEINKKFLVCFCAIICFSIFENKIFAQSQIIKNLVNEKYYNQLITEKKVIITHEQENEKLELIPKSEYTSKIENNLIEKQKKEFPFTYEALFYFPKNDFEDSESVDINKVSVACRSVSKLQGLKYYSTTRKKEQVLYEKAFTIADEQSSTPIADNINGSADGKTIFCLQDDKSFGIIKYKINYFQNENELLAVFTNVTDIGIGPIKAILPQKMVINLLVKDCGDSLLVYICTDLSSKNFPGVKGQIVDSISTRMDAISKWFISQL